MTLWQPSATLEVLQARAHILNQVRAFFQKRAILEVETPLLSPSTVPELHIEPWRCGSFYLSTSPETYMKRLLAAGSGPIFQITKAFRSDELGGLHNPEFTMLEWYRPGWSHWQLIEEVGDLVAGLLGQPSRQTRSFREVFYQFTGVDPLSASYSQLLTRAQALPSPPPEGLDWEGVLDFLLVELVEPNLKNIAGLLFLEGYPESLAAMAQIDPGPPPRARRFELYIEGMELANGYQELTDPDQQAYRLHHTNQRRRAQGDIEHPIDHRFLAALHAGMPSCAGVALGIDRLVMAILKQPRIEQVLAFSADRLG
ncbi:MAG: EF-P lysine aminoacylase EpmA [Magnetococcus sp. DMHC-6]